MLKEEYLKELEVFKDFVFFENDHHYEYKGQRVGISVTRLIEEYIQPFNAEEVASRVAEKEGRSVSEILEEWKVKNEQACLKGSISHENVQNMFSGTDTLYDDKNLSEATKIAIESIFEQEKNFYDDFKYKFEHLADEFIIGSEEHDIASAIDHLFINKLTGGLVMVDYKTNTDIHKNEKYAKKMKVPLHHLKDTTLNHYAIQLSIYKFLLEKYTNIKLEDMFIVWFSEKNDNYQIIEVPYLKNEVEEILEKRSEEKMKVVIIMGGSGTGKSYSIKNMPTKDTAVISVAKTELPFRNTNNILFAQSEDYEEIKNTIKTLDKRVIVVDDASFLTQFELLKRANQGSDFGKKQDGIAKNFYELLQLSRSKEIKNSDEKILYITMHERLNDSGVIAPKTCGNSVDDRINVEGQVNILLRSLKKDNTYVFQTQNAGDSVCKTPAEMFNEEFIPNDLYEVDKTIRKYYNMKPLVEEERKESEVNK